MLPITLQTLGKPLLFEGPDQILIGSSQGIPINSIGVTVSLSPINS